MSAIGLGVAAAKRQIADSRMGEDDYNKNALAPTPADQSEAPVDRLTQFIPVDSITLFISAVTAWRAFDDENLLHWMSPPLFVALFAILTAGMLVLTGLATFVSSRNKGSVPPGTNFRVPWFDAIASMFAFSVWALAVPGLFEQPEKMQIIAAPAAVGTSWFLSVVRTIVAPE